MKCPKCGAEQLEGAEYCQACGVVFAKLQAAAGRRQEAQPALDLVAPLAKSLATKEIFFAPRIPPKRLNEARDLYPEWSPDEEPLVLVHSSVIGLKNRCLITHKALHVKHTAIPYLRKPLEGIGTFRLKEGLARDVVADDQNLFNATDVQWDVDAFTEAMNALVALRRDQVGPSEPAHEPEPAEAAPPIAPTPAEPPTPAAPPSSRPPAPQGAPPAATSLPPDTASPTPSTPPPPPPRQRAPAPRPAAQASSPADAGPDFSWLDETQDSLTAAKNVLARAEPIVGLSVDRSGTGYEPSGKTTATAVALMLLGSLPVSALALLACGLVVGLVAGFVGGIGFGIFSWFSNYQDLAIIGGLIGGLFMVSGGLVFLGVPTLAGAAAGFGVAFLGKIGKNRSPFAASVATGLGLTLLLAALLGASYTAGPELPPSWTMGVGALLGLLLMVGPGAAFGYMVAADQRFDEKAGEYLSFYESKPFELGELSKLVASVSSRSWEDLSRGHLHESTSSRRHCRIQAYGLSGRSDYSGYLEVRAHIAVPYRTKAQLEYANLDRIVLSRRIAGDQLATLIKSVPLDKVSPQLGIGGIFDERRSS